MNGFYPMLNEVHDKAVKDLPLAECALFEHIWRKLIGWNKFEDEISISQLVKETSSCRATIIKLLKNLEEKRWILVTRRESRTKQKFTSKIAIPRCPSIESKLGVVQNVDQGVVQNVDIQQTVLTDKVTDNHPTNPNNLTTEDYLFQKLPPSRTIEVDRLIDLLGIEVIEEEIKLAEDEVKERADGDDPIRSFGAYLYRRLENKANGKLS